MNKLVNPFKDIERAMELLKALGADPMAQDETNWQEQILSVYVDRLYNVDGSHEYTVLIHLTPKGFDVLSEYFQGKVEVTVKRASEEYYKHDMKLRPNIVLTTLEFIPEDKR